MVTVCLAKTLVESVQPDEDVERKGADGGECSLDEYEMVMHRLFSSCRNGQFFSF